MDEKDSKRIHMAIALEIEDLIKQYKELIFSKEAGHEEK